MRQASHILARVIVLVLLATVAISAQHALDRHRSPEEALRETVHLPPGNVLRVVSLGFQNVVADLLWMKAVIYFGKRTLDEDNPFVEIVRKKKESASLSLGGELHPNPRPDPSVSPAGTLLGQPPMDSSRWQYDPKLREILFAFPSRGLAPYLYPLLWRVVELDPHFLYPYEFGGVVALMNTGNIREAIRLLVFGWQQNPDRWELPFYLAFIELFYLGNREQALRFLAHAMVLPGHPESVERVYVSVARQSNDRQVVADYLRSLYDSSRNPAFREQVLKIVQRLNTREP